MLRHEKVKIGKGNSSDTCDGPSSTHISRPRPYSQVSFQLSSPKYEDFDNNPMSHSEPCVANSADPPRNRRKVFRDMSYTARATRRSYIPGERRPEGKNHDRHQMFSNHDTNSTTPQSDDHGSNTRRDLRHEEFPGRNGNNGRGRHGMRDNFKLHFGQPARYLSRRNNNNSSIWERPFPTADQYRIPPPEESSSSILDVFFHVYSLAFADLAMWVYGASFGKVLLFFLALYMLLVYFFVLVLYLVDKYWTDSLCINTNDELILTSLDYIEFAFELSWTTFTTVGYGNLEPEETVSCWPIRLVCSVEAILGMAFVSICSGLFYAKLLRLLGRATVTFSSTLCVQYGKGVEGLDSGSGEVGGGAAFHPFPVIEFRIVNNRANHAPGKNEIWDAEVTAIVELSLDNDPQEHSTGLDEFQVQRSSRWLTPTSSVRSLQNANEDSKSQKVFYKLELKPSSHPYFSRVWFVRHTLNATSPLLRRDIRNMIRDSPSGWDPTLNNYQDIRECLVEFHSLQIIMSGASALSRSEVYAEKTYAYEDVCVGWRYIAVCYEEDPSGKKGVLRERLRRKHIRFGDDAATRVDLSLIHDIVPQRGNDFEPVDGGED